MKSPFDGIKDKTYKKQLKIQLGIVSGLFAVFLITAVFYIAAVMKYADDSPVQESQQDTGNITANAESGKPGQLPAQAPPEETEPVITAEPESDFTRKVREAYTAESMDASAIALEDGIYVSVTVHETGNTAYTIAHAILEDPSRMSVSGSERRIFAGTLYQEKPYILAFSGSNLEKGLSRMVDGVHIRNGELYGDTSITNGYELLFFSDGTFRKASPGESSKMLIEDGVVWSVVTQKPLLIENGVLAEIPDEYAGSLSCKSAIGTTGPGEYYFLAAGDGDYLCEITYHDMQEILQGKGCTFAQAVSSDINVIMALNGEIVNMPAEKAGRPQFEYITITK